MNASELANQLFDLVFTDYSTERIAQIAGVPAYDVELMLHEQSGIDDRSQRQLSKLVPELHSQIKF